MKDIVSLVKSKYNGADIEENLSKVINLAGVKPLSSVNSIALKLNLCYYWNASTGQTTDPKLTEAMIDFLREQYGADVEINLVEADASAMRTKYAFRLLGFEALAARKKVNLLNLSKAETEERSAEVNGQNLTLKIPKILLNSDLFVNLPKLKVMRATHLSCAMKNLFGAIAYPRKLIYHNVLAETIVAVNKILKPHLNIVDGLVALGRFPVRLNLLIAGENTFSIDWVAAQVMGFKPSRIKFLKLAIKEQLGTSKEIVVAGAAIEDFSRIFPRESNLYSRVKMKMQFMFLNTYHRVIGDIIPPSLEDT
jgi:uncharacterized protein (DUF362 family)